jgi:MFS transporter, PAT family, beta-lactamase induction signal transducer AmpG
MLHRELITTTARDRCPAPGIFGITVIPYGVFFGCVTISMPYLLRSAGHSVERIASISALALAPPVWYFLWAPLADVGFRKRTWVILTSALSAACLGAALWEPLTAQLDRFIALLVVGSTLSTIVGAANGGLMACTIPDSHRGRAGGWFQAAYTGGGAVGAGITLWLSPHLSTHTLGLVVSAMVFLPSLAVFLIPEPDLPHKPGKELAVEILRDVGAIFRSRKNLTGLAILGCPLGAAAAANLFSGIAVDYHTSAGAVVWINGFGGGLLTSLGSLAGGWICDRMSRWLAYALGAALSALCAVSMIVGPSSPTTFAVGASLYLTIMGLSFATYSSLTLELVGPAGRSAATRQTLYAAVGNAPVMYMTWLDGQGYKHFGSRGLLGTDALSNLVAAGIVLILIGRTILVSAPARVAPQIQELRVDERAAL